MYLNHLGKFATYQAPANGAWYLLDPVALGYTDPHIQDVHARRAYIRLTSTADFDVSFHDPATGTTYITVPAGEVFEVYLGAKVWLRNPGAPINVMEAY